MQITESLLIGGGSLDPHLSCLEAAARRMGVPVFRLGVEPNASPSVSWNLETDQLIFENHRVEPRAAFIRHDVFAWLADMRPAVEQRAFAWFNLLQGWLLAHESVSTLNRSMTVLASNKPAALRLAQRCGLRVPATYFSNRQSDLRSGEVPGRIAKPVSGGDLCRMAKDLVNATNDDAPLDRPWIIQSYIGRPETRLFIIGPFEFAFEMQSEAIDYRLNQDAKVVPVNVPTEVVAPLRAMMRELKMNYGAADIRTDDQGRPVFLELNTSPMFAAFDYASRGALSEAMVDVLWNGN